MRYIYTVEDYPAMRKEDILPLATTWMGLEHIMLTEVCQTKKDKYCVISLICGVQEAKTIATTKTRE